jgi:hypothetical protein
MSSKLIEEINKDITIINMMMKDIKKKALQLEEQLAKEDDNE